MHKHMYHIIWLGQSVSLLGISILTFSFGIWILNTTGSLTQFGLIIFLSTLLEALISPVAGWFADIKDRKSIILICEACTFSIISLMIALYTDNKLFISTIYFFSIIITFFTTIAAIAFLSLIPEMLLQENYHKATGLVQISNAMSRIIGPLSAGFLLEYTSLTVILFINLGTLLFSITTLIYSIKHDKIKKISSNILPNNKISFLNEIHIGLGFYSKNRKFKTLLFLFSLLSFYSAAYFILLTPISLSLSGSKNTGLVVSLSGLGSIIGGAILRTKKYKLKPIQGIFASTLMMVFSMLGTVFSFNITGIMVFSCLFSIGVALSYGYAQIIYMTYSDKELVGRVLGISRLVNAFSLSLAYLLGPIIIDKLLPLVVKHFFLLYTDVLVTTDYMKIFLFSLSILFLIFFLTLFSRVSNAWYELT